MEPMSRKYRCILSEGELDRDKYNPDSLGDFRGWFEINIADPKIPNCLKEYTGSDLGEYTQMFFLKQDEGSIMCFEEDWLIYWAPVGAKNGT